LAETKKPATTASKPPATTPAKARKDGAAAKLPTDDDDALMAATLRALDWAQKHRKQLVLGVAGLVAAGGIFAGWYAYRVHREGAASSLVAKAVTADLAPLKTGNEPPEIALRMRFYDSDAQKQQEALAAYADARAKFGDTGAGMLARLGEAGIHLEKQSWDEAIAAYTDVRNSSLGVADPQVRLRALEGLGYAREGKGLLDDARLAFDELMNVDAKGAKPLGLYHLARIDVAKGDKPAAIEKLKNARDAINAPGAPSARYLKEQVDKLLGRLDPTAVPKTPPIPGQIPGMPPGSGPGGQMSEEQIKEFIKAMQAGSGMPGMPPGGAPPPPPGAPPPPPGGAPGAPAPGGAPAPAGSP
jgi:hypothetical protein